MEKTLNHIMECDHVIEVLPGGAIVDGPPGVFAPELWDDELQGEGWSFFSAGYTGQDRYNGPIMHNSEFIGGRLERDIRSTPGLYVALVSHYTTDADGNELEEDNEDYVEGWAVAYRDAPTRRVAIDLLTDSAMAGQAPANVAPEGFDGLREADNRFLDLLKPAYEAAAAEVGVDLVLASDASVIRTVGREWPNPNGDGEPFRLAWQAVHDAVEIDIEGAARKAIEDVRQ